MYKHSLSCLQFLEYVFESMLDALQRSNISMVPDMVSWIKKNLKALPAGSNNISVHHWIIAQGGWVGHRICSLYLNF